MGSVGLSGSPLGFGRDSGGVEEMGCATPHLCYHHRMRWLPGHPDRKAPDMTTTRSAIVTIVTTLIGDPYTATAVPATTGSQAIPAAMWRCHIGDSIDWNSVSEAIRDTPSPSADSSDDPLADDEAIRQAADEVGITPAQAAATARLCAARDETALGLETLEVECKDPVDGHTPEVAFDGRHLGRDEIIHLLGSIADGSTAIA